MTSRRLTILGGHRDGDVVPDAGPMLRVPVPRPLRVYTPLDALPAAAGFLVDRFFARQDFDGRWWYVREGRE